MTKTYTIIIALGMLGVATMASATQEGKNYLGVEHYDSGAVLSETNCYDADDDGFYREYYESGALKMEVNYKQGELHGTYEDYCEDGTLHVKFEYKNNKRDGKYTLYYDNGSVESEGMYLDGKEQGEHKVYYPDGQLAASVVYKDGKETGTAKTYYKDGSIWEEFNYKNGKRDGDYRQYHPNGMTKIISIYHKGELKQTENYDTARKLFMKAVGKDFIKNTLNKKKKVLRHCVSDLLGIEFGCDPGWDLTRKDKRITIMISKHPRVTMEVEETDHSFRFMSEFNRRYLESSGRYADGFTVDRFEQCDRETVKVTGRLKADPKARVSDYYLLDHHQMHKIFFTTESEKVWMEYKNLISDVVNSLNFIKHKERITIEEMDADSCEDMIQDAPSKKGKNK